jgi:Uma2 family endonuclease
MVMLVAAPRSLALATFADLSALGDERRAEIVGGVTVEKARPTMAHGRAQQSLGMFLGRRFDRRPGGRWPGGWWFGTEVDTEYERHQIFRHDVAGWCRDRIGQCPTGRPVRLRPDWVCELLSPSNEKRDLVDKLRILHAAAVPHYWIANPEEKTLIVHRWSPQGYLIVLTAVSGETVRAEPFDGVELRVGVIFGDEEDEE